MQPDIQGFIRRGAGRIPGPVTGILKRAQGTNPIAKGWKMTSGYMLDTNVFNDVLDGRVEIERLRPHRLYATHIQRDEIGKTRDEARREALLAVFNELMTDMTPTSSAVAGVSVAGAACAGESVVPTEGAVWDVSKWGYAKWGEGGSELDRLRRALDERNKGKRNNVQDVLIAQTALRNGMTLLTRDADLMSVAKAFGVPCDNATVVFGVTDGN